MGYVVEKLFCHRPSDNVRIFKSIRTSVPSVLVSDPMIGSMVFRFSNTIPNTTRVQEWAFIDVTVSSPPPPFLLHKREP
jgi:hypothetical protein